MLRQQQKMHYIGNHIKINHMVAAAGDNQLAELAYFAE